MSRQSRIEGLHRLHLTRPVTAWQHLGSACPVAWRRLVSQRQLLHEVWGPTYDAETNYLRVHMANLRRKLEPDPSRPQYFITEPGMGYRYGS